VSGDLLGCSAAGAEIEHASCFVCTAAYYFCAVLLKTLAWIQEIGSGKQTFDQQQLNTGPSCSKRALPSLPPWAFISYMRTFLSHDDMARWSDWGENERSDMLSSGGLLNATSLEISPVVLAADVALELAALPKRPDIVEMGG